MNRNNPWRNLFIWLGLKLGAMLLIQLTIRYYLKKRGVTIPHMPE